MDINEMFEELNKPKRLTFIEVAKQAGVSRTTVYNARRDLDRVTVGVLKRIAGAMGYELVLSLKRKSNG